MKVGMVNNSKVANLDKQSWLHNNLIKFFFFPLGLVNIFLTQMRVCLQVQRYGLGYQLGYESGYFF